MSRRFINFCLVFAVQTFAACDHDNEPQLGRAQQAANGDPVHTTDFSIPCPVDPNFGVGIGVGVTFDGQFLWYSCRDVGPDLHKADPLTGQVIQSFNVRGGLGALAWDGKRQKIWAGWGGGSSAEGDIILIDPSTGVGTTMFNAALAATEEVDDGIAYDAQADLLYISPDISPTIYRYSPTGTFFNTFPYVGGPCGNSGVSVGGRLVFQGSDGCNHVWAVDTGTLQTAFEFSTGGVRDEGMTCDDVTFAPKTVVWSVEAFEPRRAFAFEIPAGSCGFGGGVDTDGDGLLDSWETKGVWIQPNGVGAAQFIDLPAMGADPNKPDIFVQLDWMVDATHDTSMPSAWIHDLVNSFASSPHMSPNGAIGINLHVDEGPASILNFSTNATWGALSHAHSTPWQQTLAPWAGFDAIKAVSFTPTGRTPIFHYAVSANDIGQGGGLSRGLPASDFIITNRGANAFCDPTCNRQYVTTDFMHELGHNLGLDHGGNEGTNRKPNYLSVMSYNFGQAGLLINGTFGHYDYSRSALPPLNEANLNEPSGVTGAPAGYGTGHVCPGLGVTYASVASGPIDWNCNGNTTGTGVSFDISADAAVTTLNGFNDWPALVFMGGAIGAAGFELQLPMVTPFEPNFPPRIQLPPPPTAQYSDDLSFTIYGFDPETTDTLDFSVLQLPAGLTFTADTVHRSATVSGRPLVPAGIYPITFVVNDGFNPASNATLNLTVLREDAVVTLSPLNPAAVGVSTPGGTSGPFTLAATVRETGGDTSPGNISEAVPVTYLLTPIDGGPPFFCTAATSGGGIGGTLSTSCTFNGIPVNAYNLTISVGGDFYQGSASTLLAVFDPSLGFVTGGGTILRSSGLSNFAINAKYVGRPRIDGSFEFVDHSASGANKLMSTGIQSLSIVGDRAYVIGEASLNGNSGYHFLLQLIGPDELGLELRDPAGVLVSTLSFAPVPIQNGRLVITHVP